MKIGLVINIDADQRQSNGAAFRVVMGVGQTGSRIKGKVRADSVEGDALRKWVITNPFRAQSIQIALYLQ